MPQRGRLALCCERRTEPAGKGGQAVLWGVSLLADTDCAWKEQRAAGHLPPFNLCVFGSYLTCNYSSVCIWRGPHIPPL